jgi:hypothetical protein
MSVRKGCGGAGKFHHGIKPKASDAHAPGFQIMSMRRSRTTTDHRN